MQKFYLTSDSSISVQKFFSFCVNFDSNNDFYKLDIYFIINNRDQYLKQMNKYSVLQIFRYNWIKIDCMKNDVRFRYN